MTEEEKQNAKDLFFTSKQLAADVIDDLQEATQDMRVAITTLGIAYVSLSKASGRSLHEMIELAMLIHKNTIFIEEKE
jgi:hypothetical protein